MFGIIRKPAWLKQTHKIQVQVGHHTRPRRRDSFKTDLDGSVISAINAKCLTKLLSSFCSPCFAMLINIGQSGTTFWHSSEKLRWTAGSLEVNDHNDHFKKWKKWKMWSDVFLDYDYFVVPTSIVSKTQFFSSWSSKSIVTRTATPTFIAIWVV
jgi:hypothetical protein